VHLRRAFGFGDTAETDPFLLLDDFRNDRPEDYLAGFPVAPAPRHRDHHLRAGRQRGARRTAWATKGVIGAGRRAVDDRGPRHPATRRCPRATPQGRMQASSCGQPARDAEDDRAALPGGEGARRSRWWRTRPAHACAWCAARSATPAGRSRTWPPTRYYFDVTVPAGKRVALPSRPRAAPSPTCSRARASSATPASRSRCRPRRELGRRQAAAARREPHAGALRQGRRGHGAGRREGRALPARLGPAAQGAGRVVRADRDEHAGASCARPSRSCRTGRF
jgi:hypothetical protein